MFGMALNSLAWMALAAAAGAASAIGAVLLNSRRLRRSRGYPACGRCRYDVTGTLGRSERCPECGSLLAEVGVIPRHGHIGAADCVNGAMLMTLPLLICCLLMFSTVFDASSAMARRPAAAMLIPPGVGAGPARPQAPAGIPVPPALAAGQIEAMSPDEALAALSTVAQAMRNAAIDPQTKQRLAGEWALLRHRVLGTAPEAQQK